MSRRWPVPVVLAIAVIAVRVVLVAAYASPVPYRDQWDAEGAYLLAPWIEGTHAASGWFAAHNEHRILWTRVLTLGLFEANGGQWDNLVSALANTLWPGLLAGGLYAGLVVQRPPGIGEHEATVEHERGRHADAVREHDRHRIRREHVEGEPRREIDPGGDAAGDQEAGEASRDHPRIASSARRLPTATLSEMDRSSG